MQTKTKKLLDNLNKIVEKPKSKFHREKFHCYTNRHYSNSIYKPPASYDKAKRIKDENDEEYFMIDRVYGGLYEPSLLQANGTEYKGKLYKKRRLLKGINGDNFYSICHVTADGRWFNNSGMPIETPKKVEEDEEKQTAGFIKSEPTEEELAEEAKLRAEREQKMLQDLK